MDDVYYIGDSFCNDAEVVPAVRQQKEYAGRLVLTNPATGKAEIIALRETETDLTAGEAKGYYQEQVDKASQTLAGPPTREGYQVKNQE